MYLRQSKTALWTAAKILEYAREHDCGMIVLGSRAHRAASLAIRSVVGKVLGHGLCPVVVIPVGAEELKSDFPAQAA